MLPAKAAVVRIRFSEVMGLGPGHRPASPRRPAEAAFAGGRPWPSVGGYSLLLLWLQVLGRPSSRARVRAADAGPARASFLLAFAHRQMGWGTGSSRAGGQGGREHLWSART